MLMVGPLGHCDSGGSRVLRKKHRQSGGLSQLFNLALLVIAIYVCPPSAGGLKLSSDVTTLLQVKASLGSSDNVILSTWDANNPICAWRKLQWTYRNGTLLDCSSHNSNDIALSQDSKIAAHSIDLAAAGLNGRIPGELSKLSSLRKLLLNSNKLVGSIPLDLGNSASLAFLCLSQNELNGSIPASLWNLCGQLVELQLDHNSFAGAIPSPADPNAPCTLLQRLHLNNNFFSGSIPSFLGTYGNLTDLDLSNNTLSGRIPVELVQLSNLSILNLAFNNLSGPIPPFEGDISANAFLGNNPSLCGPPLSVSCGEILVGPRHTGLNPKLVAALVIALLAAAVVVLALLVAFVHRYNWGLDDREAAASLRRELEEDDIGDGKLFRFEGGEHLTVEEVLNAPGEVLGKTSYGTVYKAKLTNGGMIALRLLREDTVKEKNSFAPAVQELGLIRHPNLVSLLAYYVGPNGEKLLVYNYFSRGSLSDLLHNKGRGKPPLGWARRHRIALGAARGLAHLHHGLHVRMNHGNLKSKNIIVDESFEAHLADYGLHMLMSPAAQNEIVKAAASQGYKAPELQKMSRANNKTDIYSFGMVLLEILTGKKPRGTMGVEEAEDLPTMVKTAVLKESTTQLFDMEIMKGMRSPVEDGLLQALQLAMGCCAPSPIVRPDITEVIRQLEEIRPKIPTPLYTPSGLKSPRDFIS